METAYWVQGNRSLLLFPENNGAWDFNKQLEFWDDGSLRLNGDFYLGQYNDGTSKTNKATGYGPKLKLAGVGDVTDDIWMAKYVRETNKTDLRINICDDNMNDDRLVVGRTTNDTFYPFLIVSNTGNLYLNGTARAHEVTIETTNWADFVFHENYNLRPLSEVNDFIQKNKHLPEIPTAAEVKNEGVNLGEMQTKLLQKVEELTLYLIQQQQENQQQQQLIQQLSERINQLEVSNK
jgi:hypothetical protein